MGGGGERQSVYLCNCLQSAYLLRGQGSKAHKWTAQPWDRQHPAETSGVVKKNVFIVYEKCSVLSSNGVM